jgi:hypothetical protein
MPFRPGKLAPRMASLTNVGLVLVCKAGWKRRGRAGVHGCALPCACMCYRFRTSVRFRRSMAENPFTLTLRGALLLTMLQMQTVTCDEHFSQQRCVQLVNPDQKGLGPLLNAAVACKPRARMGWASTIGDDTHQS